MFKCALAFLDKILAMYYLKTWENSAWIQWYHSGATCLELRTKFGCSLQVQVAILCLENAQPALAP